MYFPIAGTNCVQTVVTDLVPVMSLFSDLPSARNPGQVNSQADVPFVPQARSILKKSSLVPPPSILRSKKRKADEDISNAAEVASASTSHGLFTSFGPIEGRSSLCEFHSVARMVVLSCACSDLFHL